MSEVYEDWFPVEGTQYEYYKSKDVRRYHYSGASSGFSHWTRSEWPGAPTNFGYVIGDGDRFDDYVTYNNYVFPAWCF